MDQSQRIVAAIEKAIREIYDRPEGFIPLHAPSFGGREWEYVKNCLDSGWVSSAGEWVGKFEKAVAEYTGAKYAIATVNGTAAIHTALLLSGVKPGDEVLCPAFTFVATINSIIYCGAYPVFLDSDPKTLGLDSEAVVRYLHRKGIRKNDGLIYNKESGRRIIACIPMHAYGYPVDLDSILEVCWEYGISVIEDAAEALGSWYKDRHCGTFGRFGMLSFNGNKILTTGGGGMILCRDKISAKKARHLTVTAKVEHPWKYLHDQIGYNYRMPNLNAALGYAQLERMDETLALKRKQAERVNDALREERDIQVVQPPVKEVNHWFNLLRVPPDLRDVILEGLNKRGIQARASWTPVCDMPPYQSYEKFEIKKARDLFRSVICLPNGLLD